MRTASSSRLLLGFVLLLASCSGGTLGIGSDGAAGRGGAGGAGGGSVCRSVSPCGGDVVGSWMTTESCLTATEDLSSQCAGASADIAFTFSGTVLYNADLTYSATSTGGGTTTYHYPSACLSSGTTCAQWGQEVMQIGTYSSVTCATDGAGVCNCQALTASTSATDTGTYATSGGTLTTTTHPGGTSISGYCVQGNLLYDTPSVGDGGAQLMGSIVYAKR